MAAKNLASPGSLFAPLPYLLTGLAPFVAGTLLAGVAGFPLRLGVFLAGAGALAALTLAAAASREAFAPAAGRYPAWGPFSPQGAKRLGYSLLTLAILLGLVLQFGMRTGEMTIPLGALGILGGYFGFAPPLQWHRRGWGEGLGALCLGLLPVAGGFYLQCGHLVTEGLIYGLPLTFAAFNLLLVQGFPRLAEEEPSACRSLAGRVRPVTAGLIFTLLNILTITGLVVALLFPANPLPFRMGFICLIILAVVNQELIKKKAYLQEARIAVLARLTLALHLAMGLVFVISLWQR